MDKLYLVCYNEEENRQREVIIRMKSQTLQLFPHEEDGKCWIAEITGEDEVYRLKRDFLPEESTHVWEIFDGWYQINGRAAGVSPFVKEYVKVKDGRMLRHLNFAYMIQQLEEIKAMEPERMVRMRKQIYAVLDEIKKEAPYEAVEEGMERQKEECDMCDEPEQLSAALRTIKKRKNNMIKELQEKFENMKLEW
ncbi:hypothetical protein LZ578_02770 [Jeotgalibaca sp. MA1X17-3]|uniref:hypothetical protein n=1 Tax=Jeotgalibaca sp. MA1X17-3 TaxID=2908211 RepID=UPI001F4243BA|nr:hypothetical protein [Jeotgalibaca sp. MA1X17-3]UJF16080.1 hypothetical protein LZ578_02770 [Jeotgalibaca sp. MA1X17-3]